MKKFIVIFLITCLAGNGVNIFAQSENVNDRKARREQRKQERLQEQQQRFDAIFQMVSDTCFFVEFHSIQGSRGQVTRISQNTSFFALEGDYASIQLAMLFPGSIRGQHSTGRLIRYEVQTLRTGKPIIAHGNIEPHTMAGQVAFTLSVFKDGSARIELLPVNGNRYSLNGTIMPIGQSATYQGTPAFKKSQLKPNN